MPLHLSHVRFESRPLPRCPIPIPPPPCENLFHNSLYPRPRFLITFSKNEKSDLQGDCILLTKFEPIDKGLKGRSGIGRSFNLSHIRVDPPRDIFAGWAGFVTYCTVQNAILLVPDIRQLRIQLLPQVFKKNAYNFVRQPDDLITGLDLCLTLIQVALATCNFWASFRAASRDLGFHCKRFLATQA